MPAAKNPQQFKMAPSKGALEILEPPALSPARRQEIPRTAVPFRLARARKFAHVPTHVVSVPNERRDYPRAELSLPLRLRRVAGQRVSADTVLATVNISSSGVYFLSPQAIEPGTPIEVEINLVERPRGRGTVHMITQAEVVRVEAAEVEGFYGLGVSFDDITFHRDDEVPMRYRTA
jgi:PilZ domain-containing protein